MALTLAEMRAKLQAQENRGPTGAPQSGGDNAIYPHWNIDEGATTRIRFLPDLNPSNMYFWVERAMINLPFSGIKGSESKPVTVQVPCVEMWKDAGACPILAEVRTWFKDPSLEDMGRKYWKKKSYLFQGFVRDNAVKDDQPPANPIRRFVISPQIFNLIKSAILDPELENLPIDYQNGLDFSITKTSKGGYADYSTSKWSRRESSLTPYEMDAINEYGLYNLEDFLPKKPGSTELAIIKEMFEASVNGESYDLERWGSYYKPRGVATYNSTGDAQSSADRAVVTEHVQSVNDDVAPFDGGRDISVSEDEVSAPTAPITTPASGNQRAEDILAMIRNRQK